MLQRASRSGLPVMQGGAGMFTASKPADRKVVPDDPGDRTMFKVVYVVLESQYQSSLSAACKRINAGQPDVAVECSGYILEELRDPENFEQFKADVKDANIFIGSLIFVQELADKVEEVVAPERERLDAVCIFPSMPQVMPLSPLPQDTELQVAPPFTAAVVVASAPETVPQAVQSEVVMHSASMSQQVAVSTGNRPVDVTTLDIDDDLDDDLAIPHRIP